MLKYVVAMLCGVSLSGSVYMAGWGSSGCGVMGSEMADCCSSDAVAATPVSATVDPNAVDVKNTKCIVMSEDPVGLKTVSYKGKLYHTCCPECIETFNKDPEKYVKALEADPVKFGIKK